MGAPPARQVFDECQVASLSHAVGAVAEEGEEAEVAEDLELLANFGADVGILGMESCEGIFESVHFRESESGFIEGTDGVEDIEGPAAFFEFQRCNRLKASVSAANFCRRYRPILFHERNSRVDGNSVEKDVAADPTGAAGRGGKWLPFLQRRFGESEVWDAEQIVNKHGVQAIGHEEEVGCVALEDSVTHFRVSTVKQSAAEWFGAAFQLEACVALWTAIIDGWGVAGQLGEAVRITTRAVEVLHAPGFATDAGALRGAFVIFQTLCGEVQVHVED